MKRITRKLFLWFNPESGSIDIDSLAKTRKESKDKFKSGIEFDDSGKEYLREMKELGWRCKKITVHFDVPEERKGMR